MPIMFVGHGNPMNAIEENSYSAEWERVGKILPRPTAIVVMSAHWMTRGRFVVASPKPKMIYDFYGFPEALSSVVYPAMGNPVLAREIAELLLGTELDFDWGFDHGAWSVLVQMFPAADIPAIELSLDATQTLEEEYQLLQRLRPLRDVGVLFIGSGNIIHNLGAVDWHGEPAKWAIAFDREIKRYLETHDDAALLHPEALGGNAQLSIPTDEHYRAMTALLSLRDPDENWEFFNEKIDLGSIGMRSFISR